MEIEEFYLHSWSTYNIYIRGNHLFIGNDLISDYDIHDLKTKIKVTSTRLYSIMYIIQNSLEPNSSTMNYIYIKYFEEYSLLIGRELGSLGNLKGFLFNINEGYNNMSKFNLGLRKDFLHVSENGRYILGLSKTNDIKLIDCNTKELSSINAFKAKEIIWISEKEKSLYVLQSDLVKKYQI